MSKIEDGGAAFPLNPDVNFAHTGEIYRDACGMSLRDWFAGQALTGLLASGPHDCDQHGIAHDAYLHADAMLACRAKTEGGEG